ncbi:ABC transporter ATP-binding protein [Methanobrevibacter millerae]|uniref:Lipopolysaccharide transport system ATP-binding protein n=1 Tax=Methanobrevibacter millerae TaxID=230361 RepID=A0A1G5WU46_9EURY|nr:ABC transporter ATP-binding protein [Methanobrevibacter millerae]SDA61698.1 lipopolysaccharide transport system ATP-binding protein [Methanobrevibacter millerae]
MKKNNNYGLYFNSKQDGKKIINHHFNFNNIDDEKFKEEALFIYNSINEGKIDLNPDEKEEIFQELELILNHFNSSQSNEKSKDSLISKNLDNEINSYFRVNQNMSEKYSSSENSFNPHVESMALSNDSENKSLLEGNIDNKNNEKSYIGDFISVEDDVSGELSVVDVEDEEVPTDDEVFDEPLEINIEKELPIPEEGTDYVLEDATGEDVATNVVGEEPTETQKVLDEKSGELSVDDALNELVDDESSILNNDLVIEDSFDDSISVEDDVSDELSVVDVEDDVSDELSVVDVEDDVSDELSVDDALNGLIENYSSEVAIKVENLSMQFKVSKDKIDTLKELIIRTIKRNKSESKIVTALDGISFEIPKGDRVGVIGFNAAGKSTLLKVLAGVYDATGGTIETKGKIAPLLELGAGFDFNYTGKDNIFLYGAFLGYSEDFLKERYDEILEFSELGDAINYHVKTYSSGMRAKLAFSIATIVEPDILILDEILSVGDIKFRKKSSDKIRSLINSGITVLLVSHSVGQIRDLCNKAIWIDEGKLIMYGEVNEVCDAYIKAAANATKDQLENIQLN